MINLSGRAYHRRMNQRERRQWNVVRVQGCDDVASARKEKKSSRKLIQLCRKQWRRELNLRARRIWGNVSRRQRRCCAIVPLVKKWSTLNFKRVRAGCCTSRQNRSDSSTTFAPASRLFSICWTYFSFHPISSSPSLILLRAKKYF